MKKLKYNQIIFIGIGLIIFIFGFINYLSMNNNKKVTKDSFKNNIPIEDYIDYHVINQDEIYNEKLSLDIQLDKPYKKSELQNFAYYIKNNFAKKSYKRIFISYYLPEMNVGNGAWATSHFNPNLEVYMTSPFYDDINQNNTIDTINTKKLLKDFSKKHNNIIGLWKENNSFIIIIHKINKTYYFNEIDIESGVEGKDYELIVNGQKNYVLKDLLYPEKSNNVKLIGEYTDYYKIESNGDLSLYDKFGIIERYKNLDFNK